jgi:hypothetical protein
LLLTFVTGVASSESVRLYRAIVAETDRMPGLGRLFWKASRVRSELRFHSYGPKSTMPQPRLSSPSSSSSSR